MFEAISVSAGPLWALLLPFVLLRAALLSLGRRLLLLCPCCVGLRRGSSFALLLSEGEPPLSACSLVPVYIP